MCAFYLGMLQRWADSIESLFYVVHSFSSERISCVLAERVRLVYIQFVDVHFIR